MKMIKAILLIVLICNDCYLKAQINTDSCFRCRFPEGSIVIGASYIYGLDFNGGGANIRGYYNINKSFCFGPEFSFMTSDEKYLYDINAVVHYIFDIKGIGLYPVAGVNYTFEIHKHEAGPEKKDRRAPGLLAGAGLHRNFNQWTIFSEYSHHFGQLPDNLLNFGILFMFKSRRN